jgi:hypothetical protein
MSKIISCEAKSTDKGIREKVYEILVRNRGGRRPTIYEKYADMSR